MGSNKRDIVAKVFGGGEVLTYENSNFNIGKKNIEAGTWILFVITRSRLFPKSVGGIMGAEDYF